MIMVHPDYQYDPTLLPEIIKPIKDGAADVVFGSRLMGINPMKQGMPWWKYISNRFLTIAENTVFGLSLSEYHTGYRAFRREALESVNLQMDSDKFIFRWASEYCDRNYDEVGLVNITEDATEYYLSEVPPAARATTPSRPSLLKA